MTMTNRCLKRLLVTVLATMLAGHAFSLQAIEIPPQPGIDGHGKFVHDLAHQLAGSQEEMIQIAAIQEVAFEEHDVPIIVVTINRMSAYGYTGAAIQPFAKRWFNAWEIGTMDRPDGHNRGILVLVSVKDRKGRIELGGDWGYRYDRTCQDI
ncbi:MAG: TPM domain-containing protein, partial [Planctomycetaceae bacterium]|nr:TPM domain-containing protein [Planctomycetaceae bacterium]